MVLDMCQISWGFQALKWGELHKSLKSLRPDDSSHLHLALEAEFLGGCFGAPLGLYQLKLIGYAHAPICPRKN